MRDILDGMDLPDENMVGTACYAGQIVVQLLDHRFIELVRSNAAIDNADPCGFDPDDIEEVMKFVSCELGFIDFMTATDKWRWDRLAHPAILCPRVIAVKTGRDYVCSACSLTNECQPEHACCTESLPQSNNRWLAGPPTRFTCKSPTGGGPPSPTGGAPP